MLDFLLGLYFAGLVVRGWLRGLVREALDLAGMLLGIAIAFRMSAPAGELVSTLTGAGDPTARIVGGVLIFLIVGLGAAVAAHYLQKLVELPGLRMSNRLLGSALALMWGLFLATLVLSVVLVLPLSGSLHDHVESSLVASALTDPGSPSHQLFTAVAGDKVMDAVLSLQDVIGARSVVLDPNERVDLEPAEPDQLEADPTAAGEIFDLLNRARLDAGVDPLARSSALDAVAAEHAREMYLEGYFAHADAQGRTAADRVQAAGIPYRFVGENLALAATPRQVHEGLMASDGHRENILRPEYRRVGVAVIDGPLGLMVVQVFTG